MKPSDQGQDIAARHLRFGWWSLFVFTCAGLALETLHVFKVRAYLDVGNETRRLMWTLAHAHGTVLSLINIVFGAALRGAPPTRTDGLGAMSRYLIGAALVLPAGFLLGGVVFYSGDPGVGTILVPIGGLLLVVALLRIAQLYSVRAKRM